MTRWRTIYGDCGRTFPPGTSGNRRRATGTQPRPGISVHLADASVTVDVATADRLSHAIAAAERDALRAADIKERFGHGR